MTDFFFNFGIGCGIYWLIAFAWLIWALWRTSKRKDQR